MVLKADIQVPPLWRPALRTPGDLVVEHAALDCRATEVMLAAALGSGPGDVALVDPMVERCRAVLRRWIRGTRRIGVVRAGEAQGYQLGNDTTVWIAPSGDALISVPAPLFRALIVANAHMLQSAPLARIEGRLKGRTLISGVFSDRGHWFHDQARKAENLVRLKSDQIAAAFPDQRALVMPEAAPLYRRLMQLEDVEAVFPPFHVLMRRRLRIRFEGKPHELHPMQLKAAVAELGEDWKQRGVPMVPMYRRRLQRRYWARKRMGLSKGYKLFIVCKFRRGGITSIEQADSYLLCSTRSRMQVATIAHEKESTRMIFRAVLDFHKLDREPVPRLNPESKTLIEFANGSLFYIGTAGQIAFARGQGLQKWHGSEVAKWRKGPNQDRAVEDIISGLIAAGAGGENEGVLESTPDGRNKFWNLYDEAKKGKRRIWPIFLRWFDDDGLRLLPGEFDEDEIRSTLSNEEEGLIARHRLTWAQVAWRRKNRSIFGALAAQEYPEDDETCFLVSGTCYFDVDIVTRLLELVPEYRREFIPGGYTVRWKEPEPEERYVIGVDTSEGLKGGDSNGGGVIKHSTGEQVAAWHGLFSIRQQAELACRFSRDYNDALLGIERENHGHAVIQKVEDLGLSQPHYSGGSLFYHQRPSGKYDHRRDRHREIARAGWSTNQATRPTMLAGIMMALHEGHLGVRDRDFLGECLTFRLQPDGKYEADSGAHDDAVMKWAIAWQMREVRVPRVGMMTLER